MYSIARGTTLDQLQVLNTSAGSGTLTLTGGSWLITAGGASGTQYQSFGMPFSLNDITSYAEFTNIWDRFRLRGVSLELIPWEQTVATAQSGVVASNGGMGVILHSVIDLDDAAAPTASEVGVNSLQCYPSYRMTNLAKVRSFRRFLRPRPSIAAASSGAYNAGTVASNKIWIDSAAYGAEFYALKGIFEIYNPTSASNVYPMKVVLKYYLQFKDPHH